MVNVDNENKPEHREHKGNVAASSKEMPLGILIEISSRIASPDPGVTKPASNEKKNLG